MLDLMLLTELTQALEQSILDKDIEEIQRLCTNNSDFIFSIKPLQDDVHSIKKIKYFINTHQSATQLVEETHQTLQNQLFQSKKIRKGVIQYKGVKHAE